MKTLSNEDKKEELREKIIGLGEKSFRKSYYPELQKKLEELERSKTEAELYLDIMGHDINNMNQIVMGYIEMALDKIDTAGGLGKADRMLLEMPMEPLKKTTRLIDNLRKLQKLKRNEYPLEAMSVQDILTGTIKSLPSMPERQIKIDLNVNTACNTKTSNILKEVFFNIIENSIKHSSPDKPLLVTVSLSKVTENMIDHCRVIIDDDGPGISDENKREISMRFKKGYTKAKGIGTGLLLANSIVDAFKGKLRVEDRIPGDYRKGCRIVILLPSA